MKKILSLLLLATAAFGMAQEGMDMTPPVEVKQLSFLGGTWKGTMTLIEPTGKVDMDATVTWENILNGRFYRGTHKMSPKGGAPIPGMEGMDMFTYDAEEKVFRGYWFDPMGASAMEMTGNWRGNALIMNSKPIKFGGMTMEFRASYTKKSDTEMSFMLEQKGGDGKYTKMMEGNFKKS